MYWTADIGPHFGDVRPLDQTQMRTLSMNGIHLLDRLDSNDAFLADLASPAAGVITWPQREHLVNISQPRDRNDKLLEIITRRSVADFQKFTKVLSKYQAFLVPLLVTDGGKTSIVQRCVAKILIWLSLLVVTCLLYTSPSPRDS